MVVVVVSFCLNSFFKLTSDQFFLARLLGKANHFFLPRAERDCLAQEPPAGFVPMEGLEITASEFVV